MRTGWYKKVTHGIRSQVVALCVLAGTKKRSTWYYLKGSGAMETGCMTPNGNGLTEKSGRQSCSSQRWGKLCHW